MPEILTTKLFYVLLSAISFLVGVLILKLFRPSSVVRLFILCVSGFLLIMAILREDMLTLTTATSETVPYLKEIGWLSLGMLFGINRGDHIVAYLDKRDQTAALKEQQSKESE